MFARRSYQSADDLKKIQNAMSLWVNMAGDCGYIHTGDVRHRIFNAGRDYEPQDVVYIWEDASGEVMAWVLLYPQWRAFESYVHPAHRCGEFHHEVRDWAEAKIVRVVNKLDGESPDELVEDVMDCDTQYHNFLRSRGYQDVGYRMNYTERSFDDLPEIHMPEGYHLHLATVAETSKLAEVHNYSFTKKWTGDSYRKVMEAPGHEYEFVVVAPDGRFAAFAQVWLDERNRVILFEPVGTHKEFQRKGIAKAMMVSILHRMKAEGKATRAIVWHEINNQASSALYASLGFKVKYHIHEYAKDLR